MRRIIAALALVALTGFGCSTTPQTPQQAVYAIQGTYAGALTIAVAYKRLPPCGQPASPTLCSNSDIVGRLQKADDIAYPTLIGAQTVVRSAETGSNVQTAILAAQQAVAAFAAITNTLTVK